MLDTLRSAWKVTDLRKKIIYTLLMFLVFRIGAHVPVPGINHSVLQDVLQGNLFGIFDVISGGAFRRLSIFAMSITPYINASIIMSLLQVVIPKLEQLAKEGEAGRNCPIYQIWCCVSWAYSSHRNVSGIGPSGCFL